MKVSIITACRNNADTIGDTFSSVFGQTWKDIEYIVVDGDSTDGTKELIAKNRDRIHKTVSGKDGGIYFALNKGIELATGDVVAILHADDVFGNENVIRNVVNVFRAENADSVYGDLVYVDRKELSKVTRTWIAGEYSDGLFLKGWMPPHPSFFLRKSVYERFGNFNTTFRSAADYELMLRVLHKHHISTVYLKEILVRMRVGGTSNLSLRNRIEANREDRRAWKINGLKPGWFTLMRKPLSKVGQFFSKEESR